MILNWRAYIRWLKMLRGESYYHLPQGKGLAFTDKKLHGYFNDMTHKINWPGRVDDKGIPLVQYLDNSFKYFPTTIIQKGLGHYDDFLINGNKSNVQYFLNISTWLIDNQDSNGGWDVSDIMMLPPPYLYSSMPQGEAISLLVRAWKFTDDSIYLESAKRAIQLMVKPLEYGGTALYDGQDLYFEEFPNSNKSTVLNGWVFSIFGMYDYLLVVEDIVLRELLNRTLNTLSNNLKYYDSGIWSYYDLNRNYASPFYHSLHISQLESLVEIHSDKVILETLNRWKDYKKNYTYKSIAFCIKAFQKIKQKQENIVVN